MHKKLLTTLIITFTCFIIISLFYQFGLFSTINYKLSDGLYGGINPLNNIVLIAIDDKSLQEIGRWPWDRINFAKLIDKLHDASVIGIDVAFFENSNQEQDNALIQSVKNTDNLVLTIEYTDFLVEDKIKGENLLLPIGDLIKYSRAGYVNIITDNDGVTRAVNQDLSQEYKSFTEEIYKLYLKRDFDKRSGRYLINFIGQPNSFPIYSFSDVLNKDLDFKDKIVLVGATAPDLHDDYFVPTSNGKAMPGVEIHANTLQTMITNSELKQQSNLFIILTILFFSLIIAFLIYRFNILVSALISLLLVVLYFLTAIFVFKSNVILNLVYPPVTIFLTYTSLTVYNYLHESKSKAHIRNAFSRYISPVLVEQLIENPEKLKLGGEKRYITILFSDIRGFTTLSELMTPEELVSFLNEYLSEMTKIILKNKGLVDKYIGDAIMAFWGAPLTEKDQEKLACKTSMEMIEKLEELRKNWKHLPHIDIGIGLNSGECIVGNVGSDERFDYTAIGDNVNLASRLEGLNKEYGTNIIVSEAVISKVNFNSRILDIVKVKGKNKPVKIYELLKNKTKQTELFEKGFNHYINKEFTKAIEIFSKLPDKTSKLFLERSKELKKDHPKNWDGVFEYKNK